jgi:phosphatidate cytidylyltransferase
MARAGRAARRPVRSERRRTARGGGSDLGARILVAIPAAAVAVTLIALGGEIFMVGLGLFGLACLYELFAMFERARPAPLAAAIGMVALVCAAHWGTRTTVMLVFLACIPLTFLVIATSSRGGGAPGIAVTVLGLAWIGLAFSHAVLLRDLEHGGALVLAALLGTFIGDTGAYLGGRAFGRTPLAPRISPNKTIEGLLIGIVVCVGVVWYFGLSSDWMGGGKGAILGVAIAIAAPIGDLFESYLKRDAGTKDTGTLFGAHGGALDRLDAVMFTVVTTYYVWQLIG